MNVVEVPPFGLFFFFFYSHVVMIRFSGGSSQRNLTHHIKIRNEQSDLPFSMLGTTIHLNHSLSFLHQNVTFLLSSAQLYCTLCKEVTTPPHT